jgi:hypothetical protein
MSETHGFEHQPGEFALQLRGDILHRRIVDPLP